MLKKNLTLSFAILALIFAYGCGDDKPTNPGDPTPSKPKFVFKTGSYWIFENYEVKVDSSRDIDTKYTDSTAVIGTKDLFSRTATIFKTFLDEITEENYYAVDSNKLWVTSDYIDPKLSIELPINIPVDAWFLLADYDQTEWTIHSVPVKDFKYDYNNMTININGTFSIKCKRVPSQTVKWGVGESKSIVATDFQLIYGFEGTATLPLVGNQPLNFNIIKHHFHTLEAGVVKIKMEPLIIKMISITLASYPGYETVLIDYKISN